MYEEPAGLFIREKHLAETATLSKLYVLPHYHGKGVAARLFKEAIN